MGSTGLGTAAALDSMGRFVANVGVPAAITFFMLSQLTPRLDTIAANQAQTNTQLAIFSASCGSRPAISNLPPRSFDVISSSDFDVRLDRAAASRSHRALARHTAPYRALAGFRR